MKKAGGYVPPAEGLTWSGSSGADPDGAGGRYLSAGFAGASGIALAGAAPGAAGAPILSAGGPTGPWPLSQQLDSQQESQPSRPCSSRFRKPPQPLLQQ